MTDDRERTALYRIRGEESALAAVRREFRTLGVDAEITIGR